MRSTRSCLRPSQRVIVHRLAAANPLPSGYELALGFPDKLRIGTLLVDDIRHTRAINFKSANQVRASS